MTRQVPVMVSKRLTADLATADALKALLHELIDLTVQTAGHLIPLSGTGSDPAQGPFSEASGSCLTRIQGSSGGLYL